MEIDEKLLQMIMNIGFLATENDLTDEAEIIFSGLKAIREESEYPLIGMAMAKINAGKTQEAVSILKDQALAISPNNDLVKAYLGLAYKLLKKDEDAIIVFNEIIQNNENQEAMQLAKMWLER